MVHAFNNENLVVRVTGETIALTPPLIVSEGQIGGDFRQGGEDDQSGRVAPDKVTLHCSQPSLRGAQVTKQSSCLNNLDCFASLAMTGLR